MTKPMYPIILPELLFYDKYLTQNDFPIAASERKSLTFLNRYKGQSLITIIVSFLILFPFYVFGQTEMPKIVHPSPETASLFKFQDYPMDYSTGLPQISILLYEVKSGSLSVPISISYHASGRNVSDQDGPIATGWSLNAGGVIGRTIYGSQDFGSYKFPYPFKTSNVDQTTDLAYLEQIMHFNLNPIDAPQGLWKDSEYDVFTYSFNGQSGKFIFKDVNNVKTPVFLPYKPYVVIPNYGATSLNGIDIIDEKGVNYSFIGNERYGWATGQAISGYSLSRIVSADKADTITFTYSVFNQTRRTISQLYNLEDKQCQLVGHQVEDDDEITTNDTYQIARLTEIKFKNGKILFNLIAGSDKVKSIQVINSGNIVLRAYDFNTSLLSAMSDGIAPLNKLNELVIKNSNGISSEKYVFDYFPTVYSSVIDNSQINVRYRDWWGYYNASGQHDMVPYHTNLTYQADCTSPVYSDHHIGNQNANREPNLNALMSGVLKKIIFPTGGSTEYVYENNKYKSLATNYVKYGPGLRVSEIITSDNSGINTSKIFKYGVNESDFGFIDSEPDLNKMKTELIYNYMADNATSIVRGSYRYRAFYSDAVPELGGLMDRPVIYTEVAVYFGNAAKNNGKSIYNFDRTAWGASALGPNKWHVYDYNYWDNSSLIKQTDYRVISSSGPNIYEKVKETAYGFSFDLLPSVYGLHVQRYHAFPQTNLMPDGTYAERYALTTEHLPIYFYSEYRIPVGSKNLSSKSEKNYNEDGSSVNTTISYTYNANQLISRTNKTTSGGGVLIQDIKYPFDFTGNSLLATMVSPAVNMLDYPIEQIESRNGSSTKSIRTNYFNWGSTNNMIAPKTVEVKIGNNAYETNLRYLGYDQSGHPTSFLKENDIKHSYIWDYKKSYPVAEVKNADENEIAFTSFESDGTGKWTGVNKINIKIDKGYTGKQYYDLGAVALTKTGLTATTTYVVSYWSKSVSCTVSGTLTGWPKNLKSANVNGVTWNYWEHRVTNINSVSITGSSSIDELRLYPENAQMSTYAFEPLIGMSSQTDSNNITTYFEYDLSGRLKIVRDSQWNIVKSMNYNQQIK